MFCKPVSPSDVANIYLSDDCNALPCAARIVLNDGREKIVSLESEMFYALFDTVPKNLIFRVADQGCGVLAERVTIGNQYMGNLTAQTLLSIIFN